MSKLVSGKLAFVTGARSGIGREICRVLAREGAQIVATDRNIKTVEETVATLEAGITRDNFLIKLSDYDFDEVINVNLKGFFLIMQTATRAMIEANVTKDSSIINVSSIVGKYGNIGQSNYSASKAGVIAMTKTASMEFGQFGIRVNAILPGFIETPMTAIIPDNVKKILIKKIQLQRIGKPQEVAEVVTFLASNRSLYVNGTAIEITGGMY